MRHRLNKILAKHTGKDIHTVEKDTERDAFMRPDAAKEYGLIDFVLDKKITKI
jgi:ATP-dependent Clp protease protease subunit